MKKSVKKGLIIGGSITGGVILLLIIAVVAVILLEPVLYGGFYGEARKEFNLPGMSDGFVQQGLTYADGVFLTSGYMSGKGDASRIYVTRGENFDNRESAYVRIKDENGVYISPHAGGIAVYGDNVYLCNSEGEPSQIVVYSLAEILAAQNGGDVTAQGRFPSANNASFCYVNGDVLYIGEFYYGSKYPTDERHHMTTPAGDKHHATVFGYELSAQADFGMKDFKADFVYSVTDKAQGMCVTDSGKLVISTSYSLSTSHNYVYTVPQTAEGVFETDGRLIPLTYLDSDNLDEDIKLPPMAEELAYVDGRVFVMNESACNKYFFGKLLRAKYIWSYPLN